MRNMLASILRLFFSVSVFSGGARAGEEIRLYFVATKDGASVKSPFKVIFRLKGMGVAPAGINKEKTGHHHLIIDALLPDLNKPIPNDRNHRHFGGGQTETTLDLTPGKHTLQLQLADLKHVPHDPPVVSDAITIHVA